MASQAYFASSIPGYELQMIMAEVSCSNDDDIDDNGNAMKITVVTAKTM